MYSPDVTSDGCLYAADKGLVPEDCIEVANIAPIPNGGV